MAIKYQFIEYMQATFDYYPGLLVDEGEWIGIH